MQGIVLPPLGYLSVSLRCPTLPPATRVNCYVVGLQDALIVDPGSPYPAEMERLSDLLYRLRGHGGTFSAIFLTHHHRDHSAGARFLAHRFDLPIVAHPATLQRLARPRRAPAVQLVAAEEGQRFVVDGERALELVHTPGHAPGHCCLLESRTGVLVAGDMVSGVGTILIDPSEGDMAIYLRSLTRLLERDPCILLPGHGPPSADAAGVIARLIARRRWREQLVLASLGPGVRASTGGATFGAYTDAPLLRSPLAFIAALRSTLAHLIALEQAGQVRRAGGHEWQAVEPDP